MTIQEKYVTKLSENIYYEFSSNAIDDTFNCEFSINGHKNSFGYLSEKGDLVLDINLVSQEIIREISESIDKIKKIYEEIKLD